MIRLPENNIDPENTKKFIKMILEKTPLSDAVQASYDFNRLMTYYRCAMMEIETKFNVLNEEFSLKFDREPISSIRTRLKRTGSIIKKMQTHHYEMTMESVEKNLNDVAGIRVVCSFVDDVYMLAEALQKQDDIEVLNIKDYIKNPKENGYRSLHMIVTVPIFLEQEKRLMKAEIQLRTIAMDFWASLEHQLRYKKNVDFTEDMNADLRYCAELSADLDTRMDQLRSQVYKEKKDEDIIEYLTSNIL